MGYLTAETIDQALAALASGQTSVVAGGTDWFPRLGDGPAPPDVLDITRIPEFRGITRVAEGWRFGATTRWCDVVQADLPAAFDALKAAAAEVGSVQIQNVATLAGNICNASPAADGVPPLLTLDCEVELVAISGTRRLALADFITGVRCTDLGPAELVSALCIPDIPRSVGSSFLKLGSRKYLVISIAMVSAMIGFDPSGHINTARVAIGACSPVAQRLGQLEDALVGLSLPDLARPGLVEPGFLAALSPIDDTRGSADFRIHVVAELCQRAICDAAARVT